MDDLGVDDRIILKLTLKIYNLRTRTTLIWIRIETSGGLL
jgi:hypothetical protein